MPLVGTFTITVTIDRIATGGAGIANAEDGRVVLVDGGLPGDTVEVEITRDKKRMMQGHVSSVLTAGPHRRQAQCPNVAVGCGGCDWQHAEPQSASELRRQIVVDSLRRIGKVENVDVRSFTEGGQPLSETGYRTTVRAAVSNGSAGFRRASSNEVVQVQDCETAHPLAAEILQTGRFPGASEVVIRVGANTGERLVITDASESDAQKMILPVGVGWVTREQLRVGRDAWIHEEVSGHRFRISADSFFQCRPDGAAALVSLVEQAIADTDGPVIDAYSGVGLFGALLARGRALTAVESNPSSVADAKVNLPSSATILRSRVERWKPTSAAAVIADPARRGLAKEGVDTLEATGASVLALVSCDPAALGRDAGLLRDAGFTLDWVRTIDLFGNTSHVEAVSRFSR